MISIKSIWENQKPTGEKFIRTRIDDLPHLRCYAITNHITGLHSYVMSVSGDVQLPELRSYRCKGVEIFAVPADNRHELNIYLLDNELKTIFSSFVQNILEDLVDIVTENEALVKTLNVISRWKKLFDKISFSGLTLEQQKGLIGELLFLNNLIDQGKQLTHILNGWTGPESGDKDFVFGAVGVEIKMTSAKHPVIRITTERQLDTINLTELFLILYISETVKDNGFTLNSLVELTRNKMNHLEDLRLFDQRLLQTGYLDEDYEHYGTMYSLKETIALHVQADFPRIVQPEIPTGVFDVAYCIELSAVQQFIVQPDDVNRRI